MLVIWYLGALLSICCANDLDFVSEEVNSSEYGQKAGKSSTNCSCGWTNKATHRIVGGSETDPNEFPLMAGLTNPDEGHLLCGASVISAYHGLTAAHCTVPQKQNRLALYLAEHDVMSDASNRQVVHIKMAIEHEKYNENQQYDISLLVLQAKIEFSKIIGPACLPNKRLDLNNKYLKIIGWGMIRAKGRRSRTLRKVNVKAVPIKNCAETLAVDIPTQDPHQICTYAHRKDACKGDSGGPVLWLDPDTNRYTQVGIVSFGAGCGGSTPAIQTDVSYFMDWIVAKMTETEPKSAICAKVE